MLAALDTVRDPELDEAVTSLGFVTSCDVSDEGVAEVHLRLPTYFCAPNFAFLMVADAQDAVADVPGVERAVIVLDDHFAADAINTGVAASAGFVGAFGDEAAGELDELRADFVRKAVLAGTDRVCRPLMRAAPRGRLAVLTLGGVPASPELDALRPRRRRTRAACRRQAPLLIDMPPARRRADGPALHLRRARLTPGQHRGQRQHLPRHAAPSLRRPRRREESVKAVRLHAYNQQPVIDEVPEPVARSRST